MTCLKCNRKVRDTFKARWQHLQHYHLDVFIGTVAGVLVNEEKLFRLGQYLGNVVRMKTYAAIDKR